MKGVVFILLNEMIENKYDISIWEKILEVAQPSSDGVFISTENYPDEDVVKLVGASSKILGASTVEITRSFGRYLFDELNAKMSFFSKQSPDLFHFLDSIENVVHREVRKLYTNTSLPTIDCTITSESELIMKYHSPRKLCYLAEGLISGAADFYDDEIDLQHKQCMHDGADCCILKIVRKT